MPPSAKKQKKSKPAAPAKSKKKPATAYARRDDLDEKADSYFSAIPAPFGALAARVRKLVREAAPAASEAIKWGMPVYSQGGLMCYVSFRPEYLTLGFYESGTSLTDPDGLLDGTGERMRHLKIRGPKDVRPDVIKRWVVEAVSYNEMAKK